ncbi:choice-of-anchor B family protein [Rubrivirga sp.]|uniref:choice-of-anchor B family protein n=1 Tax=Rubrivirga sp. TaxID=1885344 RepID=UPI003B51BE02
MLRSLLALAALAVVFAIPVSAQPVACADGAAGEYECDRVDLLAHFTPQELGAPPVGQCPNPYPGLCANDIWGWEDAETGRRYAIVGLATGTAFVDVTTPSAPIRLGFLPTATDPSSWRDVKALGNVALVVSEAANHGIQVFDLTRLRGLSEDPARQFAADARYTGVGSAHNVVVDESAGMAYAVGSRSGTVPLPGSCSARGLHAVDFSDPLAPTFAGCFNDAISGVDSGYTHDAQCVTYDGPDADYAGRRVCFASNTDEVSIFDATDPGAAALISQVRYPTPAYTHQGWLTEDGRYFLVNDELDEANAVNGGDTTPQRTLVLDVEDLDAPEFAFVYRSGLATIDHNLYVVGDLAFESNYEAGLRVIDLSRIDEGVLEEVAFFDTYPLDTSVNFAGQWSNYPFFGGGLVVANDGETGFFVLQVDASLSTATSGRPGADGVDLSEPVPNPTAGGARLALRVDQAQAVRADLFDVAGRRVAAVYEGPAGPEAEVVLAVSGDGLPAGVYVVRVVGETFEASRRVVLTR